MVDYYKVSPVRKYGIAINFEGDSRRKNIGIMRIFMYFLLFRSNRLQTDEFDGVGAAKGYCDCLQKEHDSGKDFDARTKWMQYYCKK